MSPAGDSLESPPVFSYGERLLTSPAVPITMFSLLAETDTIVVPAAETTGGLQGLDYLVVVIYLLGVLAVGVYFSRQQTRSEDYFVGGRQMPWFAVGLSIMASLLSTISYLSSPGEMIKNGPTMALAWLIVPFVFLVVSFVWLPFLMKLKLTSVYEYLDRRFGRRAGQLASILFVFVLRLFWMGMVVLTASEAVADITYASVTRLVGNDFGLTQWTLVVLVSVGVLATLYTVLGGIKAVIWTDVVQTVILIIGAILTLVIISWNTNTGPADWWSTMTEEAGGGHEFPPLWSWDPTDRNVIGFALLHSSFWYLCTFLGDQVAMQRYFTMNSLKSAIRGNMVNFTCDLVIMVLLALCGMALLTYYTQNPTVIIEGISDPQEHSVADRVFPHFIGHHLPVGVAGLVVAALFAAAMSSLDSGINSVATVLTVDFIRKKHPDISDERELSLARWLSILIGASCTGLAIGLMFLPEDLNIVDAGARTFNCALGPLASMFLVGMFLPRVGETAVIVATGCGTVIALAISWWTELIVGLGLEEVITASRPGTFLILPLSTLGTLLIAAILGSILPPANLEVTRKLTWRAVVRGTTD